MKDIKTREERCYIKPQMKELLKGYALKNGISKSQVMNRALKQVFDKIPSQEKEQLINLAKGT